MLLVGALATGVLAVVATALPRETGLQRVAAVLGSALVVFAVLLLGAKMLLARPAPVRALWPGAILGAAAVTVVLNAGAPLLARLVAKAGPVYGSSPPWQASSPCCTWWVRRWCMRRKSQPSVTPGCGHAPWTRTAPPQPMSAR